VPRVDGDPVFCSLMNGDNQSDGVWRLELVGQIRAEQHYIRKTPILVTRLEADDGSSIEVLDFCPRHEGKGRMYRPHRPAHRGIPAHLRGAAPGARLRREPCRNDPRHQPIRYLIGPQALRLALAPMTNDVVALLKDSSLVSVITVVELTKQTAIYATNAGSWAIPGALCAMVYLAMSLPLSRMARRLEQRWTIS
jgi:hypothetical protein